MHKVTLRYQVQDQIQVPPEESEEKPEPERRKEVMTSMSRPRQHASAAAKQAAYRKRLRATTVIVDRAALDRLDAKLETLRDVVSAAAQQGDAFAHRCSAGSADTVLDKLIVAFQECPPRCPPSTPSPQQLNRKRVGPK